MLLEVSMTMVLVAQLWCIEPASDISNGNDDSGGGGGGAPSFTGEEGDGGDGGGPLGIIDLLVVGECSFSALVVYLAAPPLTCVLPALLGLVAVASGSSRGLRTYAAWNGFSIWTTLVGLIVVIFNLQQLGASTLILPFVLLFIKFVVSQLVPLQLVAIESARPVRGWRGLFEVRSGPAEKARREAAMRL